MIEKKGVIYTRVSSHKQVLEGNGLDSQYSSCRTFAKNKNIEIINNFEDGGFSGGNTERPGLIQLLDFLKKSPENTYVIIDDISRLSRDTHEYFALRQLIGASGGILLFVKNDLAATPQGEFFELIQIGVADYERKINKERVKSRMYETLKNGRWLFTAPVGLKYKDKLLIEDEQNSHLIKKIYKDFSNGKYFTYREIKDSQEARSLTNRNGKPFKLKDDFIKRLLSNPLYKGVIHYPEWGLEDINGIHLGIISEDLFQKVQIRLKNKGSKKHTRIGLDEFPLKGNLVCGTCNKMMVASPSKGRNDYYYYYRCNSKSIICNASPKSNGRQKMHDQFLKLLNKARINPQVLKAADAIFEDTFTKNNNHLKGIEESNTLKLKSLYLEKNRQLERIVSSKNDETIKALERNVGELNDQINALETSPVESHELAGFKLTGQEILTNPDQAWIDGSIDTKKAIFNFVFDENIKVTRGNIGTASYALPYRLMRDADIKKVNLVELGGIEPPTSCVPRKRSPS